MKNGSTASPSPASAASALRERLSVRAAVDADYAEHLLGFLAAKNVYLLRGEPAPPAKNVALDARIK